MSASYFSFLPLYLRCIALLPWVVPNHIQKEHQNDLETWRQLLVLTINAGAVSYDLVENFDSRSLGCESRIGGAVEQVDDALTPLVRAISRGHAGATVAALEEGDSSPSCASRVYIGHSPCAQIMHGIVEVDRGCTARNMTLERRADLDEAAGTILDLGTDRYNREHCIR